MGKSQSKHACKRREGPEGGSFAAHALTCQRESGRAGINTNNTNNTKGKQGLCQGALKEESQLDHDCHLEVALPPEHSSHLPASRHPRKRSSHADDVSSLMHSIYEVVEASVKQPCSRTTALRLKLVLTPSASSTDQEQGVAGEAGSARRPYCVDENTERRNHYLDLAGIENYSSKFDDADSPPPESRQDVRPVPQSRTAAAAGEKGGSTECRGRGLSFLRSFRSKAKVAAAGDRAGAGGKSARSHGGHPPAPPHAPLQRTHSKRLRPRAHDAGSSPSRPPGPQGQPGGAEREAAPGGIAPPTQRHEHHHEHHHHHHHHHHHYHHPS